MKDLKYLQLWDAYNPLLTEHQREICELYYLCDLSLTEIAEQKGISKQSVSDTLAKSRALLDEYGALTSLMTGSGAAVFGVFDAEDKAQAAAEALRARYKQVYLARPDRGGARVSQ